MSYIKEPVGVDFFVKSTPLTNKDRLEISAFIKASKAKPKKAFP
jgi:hypothetical protein